MTAVSALSAASAASGRCPRLQPHVAVIEQTYRGEQSFIVKDGATKKYFRFRPVEALVIQCFDGTRTPARRSCLERA